jgi:acetoin utilization deacetylase AcuC-like enzyme
VLNDVAIAVRQLRAERRLGRVLVVDLDVHQGNGTAAIFDGDAGRVHAVAARRAQLSDRQGALHAGRRPAGRARRRRLPRGPRQALPRAIRESRAELAFYLGGVDVAAGDRYGRFRLTDDGVRARDRFVVECVRGAGCPLVLTLAGGYAASARRTAELHAAWPTNWPIQATTKIARQLCHSGQASVSSQVTTASSASSTGTSPSASAGESRT